MRTLLEVFVIPSSPVDVNPMYGLMSSLLGYGGFETVRETDREGTGEEG